MAGSFRHPLSAGLLLLLPALAAAQDTPPPDVIAMNGKVVTVDADFSIAEALAVRGGRIVAVGSNVDIGKLAGTATETIDLGGRTVLPGLIDSHVHAVSAAMFEFDHEVPTMESIADVLEYVAQRAAALPKGEWIRLEQVFITRLRERRFPTRAELDRAAPDHPVWFRTGPDAALNSLALELSGIDRDFTVPDGSAAKIERHPETGEPTGIIRSASGLVRMHSDAPAPGFEDRIARVRDLLADYNKVGLTGISDRNASASAIRVYDELKQRGELSCRVYLFASINGQAPIEEIESDLQRAAAHPLHEYDSMLWLRGAKIFLDGGMLTGSAYMLEPWGVSESYGIDDPAYRGIRYVEPDKLYRIAKAALQRDLQITAHAVGDGAVETLVNAYARIAENDFPVREKRPCVTHCNFMTPDAIEKMQKHGIVADLQPAWLFLDGVTLRGHFGEDRLQWFQPYRTLFESDVVVGGGSDHMQKIGSLRSVNPYNPFLGMWITLTRQPRGSDTPLHPDQIISRQQAIQLYTINNAFLTFEENQKGSLEPGKLADFIVLDTDILACSLDDIRDTKVDQTWLGGAKVWDRSKAAAERPAGTDPAGRRRPE